MSNNLLHTVFPVVLFSYIAISLVNLIIKNKEIKKQTIIRRSIGFISIIAIFFFLYIIDFEISFSTEPSIRAYSNGSEIKREYEKTIEDYVASNNVPGLVVGIIDKDGSHLFTYGPEITGASIFEIGSISKTFTGMLLADTIQSEIVDLEDSVLPYIKGMVKEDLEYYEKITLRNLSSHTSGLPYFPKSKDINLKEQIYDLLHYNFYRDFSKEELYSNLDAIEKPPKTGDEYLYSNVGFGLLGVCLSNITGSSYEILIKEVIAQPLDMKDTSIHLSKAQKRYYAKSYSRFHRYGDLNIGLKCEPHLLGEGLQGAGGIRTTGNDMLKFLEAVTHNQTDFIIDSKEVIFIDTDGSKYGMGWNIMQNFEDFSPFIMQSGNIGGFDSVIVSFINQPFGFFILTNVLGNLTDLSYQFLKMN